MAKRSIEIAAPREFVWNHALEQIARHASIDIAPDIETEIDIPDLSGSIMARFTDVVPGSLMKLEVDPETNLSIPVTGGELSVELRDIATRRYIGTQALLSCRIDYAPRNRMESLRMSKVRTSIGLKALAAITLFTHQVERTYKRAG